MEGGEVLLFLGLVTVGPLVLRRKLRFQRPLPSAPGSHAPAAALKAHFRRARGESSDWVMSWVGMFFTTAGALIVVLALLGR
ncbi:MAG: hypothetical protein QOJ23_2902 [Actinomycetota bacterium]|jgi:hypothetical protein|nr:hypothetical protein [Actinomycetota bacterium]